MSDYYDDEFDDQPDDSSSDDQPDENPPGDFLSGFGVPFMFTDRLPAVQPPPADGLYTPKSIDAFASYCAVIAAVFGTPVSGDWGFDYKDRYLWVRYRADSLKVNWRDTPGEAWNEALTIKDPFMSMYNVHKWGVRVRRIYQWLANSDFEQELN